MRVNIYDKIEKSGLTRFWSPMLGYADVTLNDKDAPFPIKVESTESTQLISLTKYGDYLKFGVAEEKLLDDLEPMLYPSKEMRDWNRFYVSDDIVDIFGDEGFFLCEFESWASDNYTKINVKIWDKYGYKDATYDTEDSRLASPVEAYNYRVSMGIKKAKSFQKQFKPKDWVLVDADGVWTLDIFSHMCNGDKYSCIGYDEVSENNIIPYDEKLVGTKRD